MKFYDAQDRIPTLAVALNDFMNSDDLKKLGAVTGEKKLPTRKADLAEVILRHLEGDRLRIVWQSLDDIQRAAVAEVIRAGQNFWPISFEPSTERIPTGAQPKDMGTEEFLQRCDFCSMAAESCRMT